MNKLSNSYWISCKQFTVGVGTDDKGIIRTCPPIVAKFRGQPINNLTGWVKRIDPKVIIHEQEQPGQVCIQSESN